MHDQISQFLQQRIDAGDFPSAVYLVAEKGEIVYQDALGYAVVEPERIEAKLDTIYDLASLTKPLVTGLLCAHLMEINEINVDEQDDVADFLPEIDVNDPHNIQILKLLTHVSRLQAWKPFYLLVRDRASVLSQIFATDLDPKTRSVTYSDLNFLLLQFILERHFGEHLDVIAQKHIFSPLDLKNTFFDPPRSLLNRIAASENGNEYEKQTCVDSGYLQPPAIAGGSDWGAEYPKMPPEGGTPTVFRTGVIWGEVHDGNAYSMGGVAGHAGLFSTAEETFRIALQFLPNYSTLLQPDTCGLFRHNYTLWMNEARSIAFQLAKTKGSTAGTRMSPESFGHNGFTGTSLWIDPVKERVFILLTNRTHNHPLPFVNINSVRRRFHDVSVDLLDKNR